MNGYQLTDAWFEFRFQHPDEVSHAHTELYFYLVYHWNKLSQKEKFGLPSAVTMEATGIRNYKTYRNALRDLARFGFIDIVQESVNQHQAMIVAWGKNTKALTETLPEALTKAVTKALTDIVELKNNRTKEPKKGDFDLSVYQDYAPIIKKWIDYKKTLRESYKSQMTLDIFVRKLKDLSGDNILIADSIIEQSMAYQWKGIFSLQNKKEATTFVPPESRPMRVHESYQTNQ
jgi:hypothetical protein